MANTQTNQGMARCNWNHYSYTAKEVNEMTDDYCPIYKTAIDMAVNYSEKKQAFGKRSTIYEPTITNSKDESNSTSIIITWRYGIEVIIDKNLTLITKKYGEEAVLIGSTSRFECSTVQCVQSCIEAVNDFYLSFI